MKAIDSHRALRLYAGIMTVAVVWTMLSGAGSPAHASFDVIDVHRINLREADGALRLVIAARDRFPGNYFHGKEQPHPERADVAGMLFINDEGTENGGLIFSGSKRQGNVDSSGHLSFDQYDQDQVVTLEQTEQDGQRVAGLTVADRPDAALDFDAVSRLLPLPPQERAARLQALRDSGAFGRQRLFVGKTENHDAVVALRDGKGRVRLRMRVEQSGAASIEFLDEAGTVTKTERH